MLEFIDISSPLSPAGVVWPGDAGVEFESEALLEREGVRLTRLHLGTHSGTHVDAPSHFLEDGRTVDALPLERLIGPCRVLDLTALESQISGADLQRHRPSAGERLLIKTRNSSLSAEGAFSGDYVSLDPSAAALLAESGVLLVGIDYLSVERRGSPGHPVHTTLLGADVVVVEGLRLALVEPGEYSLICLPLRLTGLDGSPARAVLERIQG